MLSKISYSHSPSLIQKLEFTTQVSIRQLFNVKLAHKNYWNVCGHFAETKSKYNPAIISVCYDTENNYSAKFICSEFLSRHYYVIPDDAGFEDGHFAIMHLVACFPSFKHSFLTSFSFRYD